MQWHYSRDRVFRPPRIGGEAAEVEEMQKLELEAEVPERPPMVRLRPPLRSLPLRRETRSDGLFELIYDYAHPKFVVLADLSLSVPSPCNMGMMSTTAWTRLRAIESMSASLQIPNVGWRQMFLLLCTILVGWKPGSPLDAARHRNRDRDRDRDRERA